MYGLYWQYGMVGNYRVVSSTMLYNLLNLEVTYIIRLLILQPNLLHCGGQYAIKYSEYKIEQRST